MKPENLLLLNPSTEQLESSSVAEWLETDDPLPAAVEFLPLQTKSLSSLIPWLFLALFFLAWVVVPLIAVSRTAVSADMTLVPYLAMGALAMIVMFTVFLVAIFSFLWREYTLTQAQRHGRLRHGIFLDADNLLIRQRCETLVIPKTLIEKIELIEERKGQRLNEFIELTIKDDSKPVRFIPEVEFAPQQLLKKLRLWRAYANV